MAGVYFRTKPLLYYNVYLAGDTVTQHAALACVCFSSVFGQWQLIFYFYYAAFKAHPFLSPCFFAPMLSQKGVFVLDQSLTSIRRSCCVSSSFWKCTWRVPVLAAGSPLQHVQGCCPSWWTLCTLGPLQMYSWCRLASPTIASSRATTIVSNW